MPVTTKITAALVSGLVCSLFPLASLTHPGGVDSAGCHNEKATSDRHCHPERLKSAALQTCNLKRPPRAGDEGVFYGPFVRVMDGDTFEVKVQGVVMEFRLAEVDAPELKQRYGPKSRDELVSLLSAKRLVLVPLDTDRYGRTVVFVWQDGLCVNEEMVRRGASHFYDVYSTNDYLYWVEKDAREKKRGLWALPLKERLEPWVWRKDKR